MIEGIEIENLRGICTGGLTGLSGLTVLVGPSGSGKSTVLDALLIAASPNPADAVGRTVRRRAELPAGAHWLFARGATGAMLRLRESGSPDVRSVALTLNIPAPAESFVDLRVEHPRLGASAYWTRLAVSNDYAFGAIDAADGLAKGRYCRLIDTEAGANHASLVRVYEEAFQRGRSELVNDVVRAVLEGAKGLRIGAYQDGERDLPLLHVDFADYSVPVAGAGSGVYSIIRLALELSLPPGGTVLVEEPEVHQHPTVLVQAARVLWEAVRRGVQVIVSTHSLELIDTLLAAAAPADVDSLSVVRVLLRDGRLSSSTFRGEAAARAREALDEDFR